MVPYLVGCAWITEVPGTRSMPSGDDTAPAEPVDPDLVLHLPFDGSLADASGNAWPQGTLASATYTEDRHGTPNGALASGACAHHATTTFDGTQGGIAFSVWLRRDDTFIKGSGMRRAIAFHYFGTYSLFYEDEGLFHAEIYDDELRTPRHQRAPATLDPKEWVHFALSTDTTTGATRVWLDGQVLGLVSEPVGSLYTSSNESFVGCTKYESPFPGAIDDLRVYQRPLQTWEVQAFASE